MDIQSDEFYMPPPQASKNDDDWESFLGDSGDTIQFPDERYFVYVRAVGGTETECLCVICFTDLADIVPHVLEGGLSCII